MSGQFIVFEGIDGAGKGVQIDLLAAHLTAQGKQVFTTAEPSNGTCGRLLRQLLNDKSDFDDKAMALLFAADRIDHLANLAPYFAADYTVISDRHWLSSLAYNGDKKDEQWLLDINAIARQKRQPDLTILLDLPVKEALTRISLRGNVTERYESEKKLEQVRQRYLNWAQQLPERIEVINANDSEKNIALTIKTLVSTL